MRRLGWVILIALIWMLLFSPRFRERLFSNGKMVWDWGSQAIKGKTFFSFSKDFPFLTSERNDERSDGFVGFH